MHLLNCCYIVLKTDMAKLSQIQKNNAGTKKKATLIPILYSNHVLFSVHIGQLQVKVDKTLEIYDLEV